MPRFRLSLLALLFLSFTGRAQYVFTNLQVKDGLSANEIISICKDSEGFLWIGTASGLNRYDGSTFKIFSRRNKNFDNVASETITTIAEYDKDKIFTGNPLGLSYYDKKKGNFTAVPFLNEKRDTIRDFRVDKLIVDPLNRLWIFTWQGVYIYKDGTALPASSLFASAKELKDLFCLTSACQLDTTRQGIWIGAKTGLYFINYKTGEVYSPQHNPKNWTLINDQVTESLAMDHKGNIWLTGNAYHLGYYDFATNTVQRTDNVYSNGHLVKFGSLSHRLYVDSKNRLWICTWLYSVYVREPDGTFINLPEQSPPLYKLGYSFFHDVYEDGAGNIWIGTLNGLSKLSVQNPLINLFTIPANQSYIRLINSSQKIGDKQWFVNKEDGIYIFNEQTGASTSYLINGNDAQQNRIFCNTKINGTWWCGTGRGIWFFDLATKRFTPFTHYPGNKPITHSVTWIHEDRQKNIWYAVWGDAIYRYDPQSGESLRFDGTDPKYGDISPMNSLCVLEDHNGLLWFGYGESGLRIFDYATGRFSKPSNANNVAILDKAIVSCLLEDSSHTIWLGTTSKGVMATDDKGNFNYAATTENGLSSNNVVTLQRDTHGIMWIATAEGLHFFRPGEKNTSKVDINMELPFGDTWSFFEDNNDKLYVSVMNRLAVIDISRANTKAMSSPPLITEVSIFEKKIPFSLNEPQLKLGHNQNFFSIEFSSPQHSEFPSLQYAYKLEGFDKDWVYCGRRQIAAYTNVPGGDYTFKVKCTDANGQWSESITSIHIIVKPPFWKTIWFGLIVLLLLALTGWWLYRRSKKRKQKKGIDRTIDYFANSVYGENSVNEICWDIARNCISQLQFEDCVVYLLDRSTNRLVQKAAYGPKNPKGHEIVNPIEITLGKGIVGTTAASGKPLLINDTSKDERYIVDDERRFSELSVPILHDNKVIGVIDSEHRKKNFFTEEHLKAMTTIASISANKIAEAQAEEYARMNEIKLLEINKMLAESQLMALRAQMNPHFVFNCLNSIQECIVTQKYGEASKYLNKFSKLFRMVLNNSGKNLVTIDEEKEVLELYLELEQMRFEKSFSWEMMIDDEMETDEILIPSMLLQPYVENALWHGLMHKDGDRKLSIAFQRVNEEVFRCVIDDNGIGRKRSFELKAGQSKAKRHESKGLKISKDRIDVLQKQGYHATLKMIDKTDEAGNATGTTIIIELSNFLKS